MTEYTHDELVDLTRLKIPTGGGTPAAWWVATDPTQLNAYDEWQSDHRLRRDEIEKLAQSIGLGVETAMITSWHDRTELTGFSAPNGMYYYAGHPEHVAVPNGWRLDRKRDVVVPSRRTKSDRESAINVAFNAVKNIPNVRAYVTGLPTEIYLDDRNFGGTSYGMQYRRGAKCVMAFCNADPDRSPDSRAQPVDESLWHRQKLSAFLLLREAAV